MHNRAVLTRNGSVRSPCATAGPSAKRGGALKWDGVRRPIDSGRAGAYVTLCKDIVRHNVPLLTADFGDRRTKSTGPMTKGPLLGCPNNGIQDASRTELRH